MKKNDSVQLANKLKKILTLPVFYNQQANRNLLESKKYMESLLNKKRQDFYNYLINLNS